jgi:hypothetical protein
MVFQQEIKVGIWRKIMKASRLLASVLSVLLIAGTVSIMSGCGSSSTPSSGASSAASTSFAGTQSPGDFWSWTINNSGSGTFTAVNNTKNLNYSGSVSGLAGNSAGISKLSVTSTTDPGLTPPASAYVVEVPDTALLVATAPFFTDVSGNQDSISPPVFAVAQGSCPSTGVTLNWITMPPASWCPTAGANSPLGNGCPTADDAYGTAVISVSGGTYGISVTPYRLDGTPGSGAFNLSGCTCTNGLIQCTDSGNNPVRIAFTPSGVFFVDTPSNAFAGIVQPDSNIDLADFLNARTFKGMWYTSLDSGGIFNSQSDCTSHGGTWISGTGCGTHSTQPIFATTDGTQLTGHPYSDIDNGTASTQGGSINFANASQPVPGLIRATFTSACGGPTSDIVVAVRQVNNKYVGLIITHSPCTTFDVGFNVLAIEQ